MTAPSVVQQLDRALIDLKLQAAQSVTRIVFGQEARAAFFKEVSASLAVFTAEPGRQAYRDIPFDEDDALDGLVIEYVDGAGQPQQLTVKAA